MKMWQNSYDGSNSLYLIPTPIGNLEDITLRTINILKEVDVVFSEDTRVTKLLLTHLGINKKLIALHDHNEDNVKEKVLDYLKDGKNVGLVTDRGTPIISDPGYKTVKYISDNGYNVIALPGPCAFIPALIVSGLDASSFVFYGFLNSKSSKRKKELEDIKNINRTLIFYEAPHRLMEMINDLYLVFGNRNISISREITKKFESVYRGTIENFIKSEKIIKGEFVIIVEGCYNDNEVDINNLFLEIDKLIDMGMKKNNAIKVVSEKYKISKNVLYNDYHNREEK